MELTLYMYLKLRFNLPNTIDWHALATCNFMTTYYTYDADWEIMQVHGCARKMFKGGAGLGCKWTFLNFKLLNSYTTSYTTKVLNY